MTGLVQRPIPHPAPPAECERLPVEPNAAAVSCPELQHCPSRFTTSELRVLLRIAIGLTDDAVASACHLSPHTVRHHVAPVLDAGRCLCSVSPDRVG
jgi:DNA-binding NarL/FixJ family response regulator